jgi:Ni,Fe-hydrogenase I small subunit
MSYLDEVLKTGTCPSCQNKRKDIDERYSFGAYAGVMCEGCAKKNFRDGCGLNQPMGTRQEYEYDNGPYSYDGDF